MQNLDFLTIFRGLLALSVVIWHSVGAYNLIPFFINIPGRVAVWIFFGISGYVISYGFISQKYKGNVKDLQDFYINRALKILPLFFLLSFLAWATEYSQTGMSPVSWGDIPSEIFALQFNQNYKLNGVFWTLGIELQFYLIAPFIILPLIAIFNNRVSQSLIAFALYFLSLVIYKYQIETNGWSFDGRNILANLSHFLIGILGCIATYGMSYKRMISHIMLIASVIGVFLTAWLYKNEPFIFWSFDGILLVDVLILMLVIFHASSRVTSKSPLFNVLCKPMIFLGVMGYGVYGWHAYFMKYSPIPFEQSLALTFFLLVPLSILAAFVTHLLLEKPLQKLRKEKSH